MHKVSVFFFFQAEDGIRDVAVTGVQTCALPISTSAIGHLPAVVTTRKRCDAGMVTTGMMRPVESAAPREHAADAPGWWHRVWRRLMSPPSAELVLDQLNRQLAVLEGARAELEVGWVQGGWWSVTSADGNQRLVTGYPAPGGGPPDHVDRSCLVGALARAGSPSDGGPAVRP